MGGTPTAHEVYATIESVFEEYGQRRLSELTSHKAMTTEELHMARGKAIAVNDLVNTMRNTLGYDHRNL